MEINLERVAAEAGVHADSQMIWILDKYHRQVSEAHAKDLAELEERVGARLEDRIHAHIFHRHENEPDPAPETCSIDKRLAELEERLRQDLCSFEHYHDIERNAPFTGPVAHEPDSKRETVEFTREAVLAYLDSCIRHWRAKRDNEGAGLHERYMAYLYVDCFQSVRTSLFGELLPAE